MKHLVFYDGACGFCDRSVEVLLGLDKKQVFAFAPLQGTTAAHFFATEASFMEVDSLILIENYQTPERKIYKYGQSVFRICWLLGGGWRLLGLLSFIPGVFYDWSYRLLARNRLRFFQQLPVCRFPDPANRDRFLP